MRKHNGIYYVLLCIVVRYTPIYSASKKKIISPSRQEALAIGKQLWKNECSQSISGLTSWNKDESFASLGIGHFIWFPRNCFTPYTQTFPQLLAFFKQQGVQLPAWLKNCTYCPWNTREEFINALQSTHINELQTLLSSTVDLQVLFVVERMQKALPSMIKSLSPKYKAYIKKQFYRIAQSPNGLYALIDYINFKGEGTNLKERYNGNGWGLLQVLTHMDSEDTKNNVLENFVESARMVLSRRVYNSPNKKIEEGFLPGWFNRLKTYTQLRLLS